MALTYEITFVDDELLASLDGRDDARIASIMFKEDRPSVSLGRAWHIIHTLLAGTKDPAPGPLAFIFGSGRMLGKQDADGGYVSAFSSAAVAQIQAVLPTAPELAKRYQEKGLPEGVAWASRLLSEAGAEYFLEVYRELLDAMKKAVQDRYGMLAGLI